MQVETILVMEVALLLFLVLLSATFSGSETALFSLSRARLLKFKTSASRAERCASELMESYHYTLTTISMSNMLVNVGAAMIADEIIRTITPNPLAASIISVFFAVFILLIFGEVTPKTIALLHNQSISLKVSRPLWMMCKILFPLVWFINKCFAIILDLMGRRKSFPLTPEEYSAFLDTAGLSGAFAEHERRLLESALLMSEKQVVDAMTGRVDVVSIRKEATAATVKQIILREKKHFFPIITGDIDDADYLLSAKRFFMLPAGERKNWYNSPAAIKVQFVPENAGINLALENMNRTSVSAALVTDEYGRVSGLISKEDIFAEMIGDINDEHDEPDHTASRIDEHTWKFTGMIPVYLFEEKTGWELSEEFECSTVNGIFSEKLERLPLHGDEITIGNISLRVDKLSKHRASEILARRIDEPSLELDGIEGEVS